VPVASLPDPQTDEGRGSREDPRPVDGRDTAICHPSRLIPICPMRAITTASSALPRLANTTLRAVSARGPAGPRQYAVWPPTLRFRYKSRSAKSAQPYGTWPDRASWPLVVFLLGIASMSGTIRFPADQPRFAVDRTKPDDSGPGHSRSWPI